LTIWETATRCAAEFASTNLLNSGLRGVPVGTWANPLRANGLKPFFRARKPPVVKAPMHVILPLSRALHFPVAATPRYGQRSHNTHISNFRKPADEQNNDFMRFGGA